TQRQSRHAIAPPARASGAWAAWRPDEAAQGCDRVSASCSLVPASTPGCVERRKNCLLTSSYRHGESAENGSEGNAAQSARTFQRGQHVSRSARKKGAMRPRAPTDTQLGTSQTAKRITAARLC